MRNLFISLRNYINKSLGRLSDLTTTNKDSLVEAINEAGDKTTLNTTEKGSLVGAINELRTDIYNGVNTTIVYDQTSFNAIWERTGSNAYKIKDAITSLVVMPLAGGYDCYSASSFIDLGTDTHAIMSTNNCLHIEFRSGAFLYVEDTLSYLNINASFAKVTGAEIRYLGTTAVAATNGILVAAATEGVVLYYPKVKNTKTNAAYYAIKDDSAKAVCFGGLVLDLITTTTLYGYRGFRAINGATFDGLTGTVNVGCYAYSNTYSVVGCRAISISTNLNAFGFQFCDNVVGCVVDGIESLISQLSAYYQCDNISRSEARSVIGAANFAHGFWSCNNVSGCQAKTIGYTGTSSSYSARGFYNCNQLSGCTADDINATGANGRAFGFHACARLSACLANDVTAVTANRAYGYYSCTHMDGSCEATAIDDYDFYVCSNEPFKGEQLDVLSQKPYTATNFYVYTAPKDGFIYGHVRRVSGNGTWIFINEGSYASSSAADMVLHMRSPDGALNLPYCIPVKAGEQWYFSKNSSDSITLTMRFRAFGTSIT